jgi:hypothetical protein
MNSVGQSGDKKSYRVILLLVVGLTAFSSAMKELNQVREFTRETSDLVASWSNMLTPSHPAEKLAPVDVPRTAIRLEACEAEGEHSVESIEPIQLGVEVAPVIEQRAETKDVGKTVVVRRLHTRAERHELNLAALPKHRVAGIDMGVDVVELRKQARRLSDLKVTLTADDDNDGQGEAEIAIPDNLEMKLPQVKIMHRQLIINQAERDSLLKSLNRGLNLRSAG